MAYGFINTIQCYLNNWKFLKCFFIIVQRRSIYKMKRSGLNIKPCETPQPTLVCTGLIYVSCFNQPVTCCRRLTSHGSAYLHIWCMLKPVKAFFFCIKLLSSWKSKEVNWFQLEKPHLPGIAEGWSIILKSEQICCTLNSLSFLSGVFSYSCSC